MRARLTRLAAAGLIGAASLVGLAAPAQAAACTRGTGVTVVVNSSVSCVTSNGGNARAMFKRHHTLRDMSRDPGFVCQIDGAPANHPCVKAGSGANWALWWSNGTSGWIYSNVGVDGLSIPKGGWVAFVYQSSKAKPGVTPRGPAPAHKPKPAPAKTATAKPTAAKPSPTTSASGRTATPKSGSSASTPTPGSESTASTPSTSGPGSNERGQAIDDGSSTSMLWVGGLLAVALLVAVGVIVRARSQRP